MKERRTRSLSLRLPVTLFVIVLALIVTLTVLWHVVLVQDYQLLLELAAQEAAIHWTYIVIGNVLFVAIIILSSLMGAQLISHIRWSRRQSNFISSVSHELNSPLSSIKLFAQTLRRPELDDADRQDFTAKILFDVERLQRLIANILRAAEIDNSGDELQVVVQRVELYDYLREYIRDAAELKQESGLQISLRGEPDLWIRLDRMMFRQVLDNLIDNAVRYRGDAPPRVELSLARAGGWVELSVKDHGMGVEPHHLARLFERFYRGEEPHTRRKGTGIGLFVVRSIVEAHGGKLKAASEGAGRGTTITIQLPAPAAESAEAAVPQAPRVSANVEAVTEP